MLITVNRQMSENEATMGVMYVDGKFETWTLEDQNRERPGRPPSEWKVYGKTAIPAGKYKVTLDMSTRFKRLLPHILDVPDFSGIRIHAGNTSEDTDGCILVGAKEGIDKIAGGTSRPALYALQEKIQAALTRNEKVEIIIINPKGV